MVAVSNPYLRTASSSSQSQSLRSNIKCTTSNNTQKRDCTINRNQIPTISHTPSKLSIPCLVGTKSQNKDHLPPSLSNDNDGSSKTKIPSLVSPADSPTSFANVSALKSESKWPCNTILTKAKSAMCFWLLKMPFMGIPLGLCPFRGCRFITVPLRTFLLR